MSMFRCSQKSTASIVLPLAIGKVDEKRNADDDDDDGDYDDANDAEYDVNDADYDPGNDAETASRRRGKSR